MRYVPEQLVVPLQQLRSASDTERRNAREALLRAFEPLVRVMAKRYWQPMIGCEADDLEQVARIGLLEACDSYDEARGTFQTHASWGMRHALALYVRGLGNPVRLSTRMLCKLPKVREAARKLAQELHREPTLEEIAAATHTPPHDVATLLVYDDGPVSLDDSEHVGRSQKPYTREDTLIERLITEREYITGNRKRFLIPEGT